MEFERSPDPATLSRALMMRLQRCGNLPGLYRDIRESTVGLSPQEKDPGRIFDRPPETAVAAWQEMLMKNDCR